MTPVLEARSLSKSFGAVVAAADINVRIADREVVGVIGANGAGKTTFINMVTGYLKPSAGEVLLHGDEITGLVPRKVVRRGVRRSFQVSQLFGELSALDNMLVAVSMLGDHGLTWLAPLRTGARVREATEQLERFGIAEHARAPVATLPQGVRKLLDIAMSTVGGAKLLLLDEPTSGVAVDEKLGLMDTVMGAVRARSAACLFVEHDMEVVERYAPRVIAFYDGRILADGPTAAVLADAEVRKYVIGAELHRRGH